MELNHKIYEIYGEGNKPVRIKNAKDVLVLRNGESNGATLQDVCRKIDDFETNKIWAWSVLEFYKPEDGYLCDNEGNKISLLQGEEKIFFKKVKNPLIILDEKPVTLDYIRDVSSLLGLNTIEETITGLSNEDKQILVNERMEANEKRQQQIKKEKEEADIREKQKLEQERLQLEKEQKEEEERLAKLEEERITAEKQEKEEEEKRKLELEEKKKIEAEEKRKKKEQQEEQERIEEQKKIELKRKKEREENENVYSPAQYRDLRKSYLKRGFVEYVNNDGKYIFFFMELEEGQNFEEDEKPFVILKTEEDYEELVGGELTINNDKTAEYEFKDNGEEKVVTLNKKTDSIRVQVLA